MEENKTILKEEGEEKVEEKTQKIEDEGKIEPEEEIQEKKEEEKVEKIEKLKKYFNMRDLIKYIIIGIVVLIVALLLPFGRKQNFEYDRQIPYVWQEKLMNTLNSFTSLKEHDQFLLLYGPHGHGKSRGIREFAKIKSDSFLPFIIDFRVLPKNIELKNFKELIKSQLIDTISSIPAEKVTKLNTVGLIQVLTSISLLENTGKTKQHYFIHKNKDLQKIGSLLCSITDSIETDPTMGFRSIFNAIDALEQFNPCIYILHADNLGKNENIAVSRMFKPLIQCIMEFSSASKKTPIIIEVSDSLATLESMTNVQQARLIYVNEFSKKEATETLTKANVFSPKDISQIYNQFGGYGSAFSQVMDLSRFGSGVSKAIDSLINEEKDMIGRSLFSATKNERNEKVKLLKDISKNGKIKIPKNGVYKELIEKGVLTVTEDVQHITFQNKAYKKIFDDNFSK